MSKLVVVAALAQVSGERPKDRAPQEASAAKQRAAERLEFMKQSVSVYELALEDAPPNLRRNEDRPLNNPRVKAALRSEPLLRWSNIHGEGDATLFLWTSAGRPVAIAQAFSVDEGRRWLHEFQSLSIDLFSLEREGRSVWAPKEAGIDLTPLAEAPVPAKTAALRLSQMHTMAKRFAASDDYGNAGNLWQLRLLSRPVYRYAASDLGRAEKRRPEGDPIDGAVFAFVVGTDPEMLLLVEARGEASGAVWHYALAPMTAFALKATLDGKPIWSRPFRGAVFDRRDSFFTVEYRP